MGYFIALAVFIIAAFAWYRWIQQRDNIDENVTWDEGEREEPINQ